MTVATNLPREAQAFDDAVAVGESGWKVGEPGDYTILYGGKANDPATPHFNDGTPSLPDHFGFPDWPGVKVGANETHAAGRYQFEPSTWLGVCNQLFPAGSTPDFRNPADQDWGAWLLAKDAYHRAIGADLGIILHAGVLSGIASALRPTWTSLSEITFPDRYKAALMSDAPAPTPATPTPPIPAPAPAPAPASSVDLSTTIADLERVIAALQARIDKLNAALAALKEAST